ncbi:MAG: hypothetical protein MI892_02220, partial [Desulfobacterales bacterium]|nr:hypothetical protein [Desulfobacterales bacterium]
KRNLSYLNHNLEKPLKKAAVLSVMTDPVFVHAKATLTFSTWYTIHKLNHFTYLTFLNPYFSLTSIRIRAVVSPAITA